MSSTPKAEEQFCDFCGGVFNEFSAGKDPNIYDFCTCKRESKPNASVEMQKLFMSKDEMRSAHEIAEWTANANLTINSMIVRISNLQDYCRTLEGEHKRMWEAMGREFEGDGNGFFIEANRYASLEQWLHECPNRSMFMEAMCVEASRQMQNENNEVLSSLTLHL